MVALPLEKLLDYTENDITKEPHFEVGSGQACVGVALEEWHLCSGTS